MEENAIGMPDSFFERLNKKNGFADDTTAAPVDSGTTPVATDKTIPSGMPDSFFEKLNSQQHYADTNNWAENYKRYIPQAEENPSAWDNIKNNFFAIKDASEASMYGGLELMSRQGEKSGNANFANFIKAAGMYYGADPNWLVKNMQENEAQSQEELKRVWLDPKMGQFNATDMFADPKSFFQTQLPQMLGGSATLMAAGMGIAKGVQTGVMALGAAGAPFTFGGSAVAAGFIGGAVASAISRPIESLMEGYGAFDEAYSELAKKYPNATHQQLTDMAMPVFNKTFDENMQLQVLDAVQIGLSIIPVTAWGKGALSGTGAIGRMARRADMMRQRYNVAAHIGETAFQMGTEGWEEGRQMQITNEAINKYVGTDKPTSWYDMLNTKEGQSAVSGGAFMGGMMESPGILKLAYNKLTGVGDDIKTKPYEDIKQKQTALFYGNIAKSVNEGTTNEMMQAINKFGRSGVLATVETDDADSRNKSSIAEAKRLGDEVAEQVGVFSRMKEQYPDVSEKGLVRMFQNNALIRNNANALKTLSEDNVTDAPIIQRINAQNEALNKENNDIIAGKDVWETPSHEDPFADPEKDKEADIPFDSVEEVEAARLKEIEALQQIPTDGMTDEQMHQRTESLAEINSRYEDLKNRLTEKINDAKGHYENQRVLTEMLQNNIPVEGTIQKAYGMHYDFVTQDGKTVRFYNQATHDVVDDNDFNGSAFLVLRKAEQGLDGTYKDEKGNYLFRSVLGDKDHAERIEVHTTDKDGNDKYLGNVAVSNAEDYNIARDRAKAARMEKLEGEDGEGEGFSVSDEQLSGVKTTSNEQAAEAQSYGFRNAYHALNSVNKYFDADYTDYANIPKEDLALVGRIKQEEAASATTTTPPPVSTNQNDSALKDVESTAKVLEKEGLKPTLKNNGDGEMILQVDDIKGEGKRSVGVIGLKMVEVDGKKFLSIGMTSVREGYEGKGLATNMYRYLMENLPEGYDGILSPKETRWNNEQIPKIHEKLAKEYDKTELDNGDIIFKPKLESLLSKEQTPTASDVESTAKALDAKKADIERRRQEELDRETPVKNENITVDFGGGVVVKYQVITYKNGSVKISKPSEKSKRYNELSNEAFRDYAKIDFESDAKGIIKTELVKDDYTDEQSQEIKTSKEKTINAKYDAELKALGQQPTSTTQSEIEAKKADIERRRQEDLDKTNAQLEKIEKNGDSFIRAKIEVYTTLSNEETLDEVEIITFKDGSRRIRTTDSKTGELILDEKIKKDNSTTNEKFIEEWVGNLDNTLKKISEDNNPNKTVVDKINAKYDAELKALGQQPTTSNQSEIEAKKAEIEKLEKDKQEELTTLKVGDSYDVISSTGSYDGTWTVTEITDKFYRLTDNKGGKLNMGKSRVEENLKRPDGVTETKYRKSNRNEINAKYDTQITQKQAELKALEQQPTSTTQSEIEAKKADIERRRQENDTLGKSILQKLGYKNENRLPNGNVKGGQAGWKIRFNIKNPKTGESYYVNETQDSKNNVFTITNPVTSKTFTFNNKKDFDTKRQEIYKEIDNSDYTKKAEILINFLLNYFGSNEKADSKNLQKHYVLEDKDGTRREPFKHLSGGEIGESDFTIYIGSADDVMKFISDIRTSNPEILKLLHTGNKSGDISIDDIFKGRIEGSKIGFSGYHAPTNLNKVTGSNDFTFNFNQNRVNINYNGNSLLDITIFVEGSNRGYKGVFDENLKNDFPELYKNIRNIVGFQLYGNYLQGSNNEFLKLTGTEEINAKYDAELKALGQQPTSTTQSEIEAKKADIERRRQEELATPIQNFKNAKTKKDLIKAGQDWIGVNPYDSADSPMGVRSALLTQGGFEKGKELFIEFFKKADEIRTKQINAKYDAELKAVESLLSKEQTPPALRDVESEKKQIEDFGVAKEDVEATHGLLGRVFDGLKKAGLTAAKNVGEWVGIGKGTEKPYSLKIDGKDTQVKNVQPEVVNGFYSPLEKIITESKFDKLPAKQWAEKYANSEEAKWTGLKDWLAKQQGSVSKADIQQYLKDNRIQVVEVVKGNELEKYDEQLAFLEKQQDEATQNEDYESAEFYERKIQELNDRKSNEKSPTKFSQYQLEGEKENYKEVLVTLPQSKQQKEINRLAEKYGVSNTYTALRESNATDSELEFVRSLKNDQFKSSHFDEPNILVHLRMNTRTDADGNKVLFLEEVQSDWGQKGKKEGFVEKVDKNNIQNVREDENVWVVKFDDGSFLDISKKEAKNADEAKALALQSKKERFVGGNSKIPTAPFVTDTNAWTKLGLKVALKEAVAQGADKIAWTTGEQQNARYDLSKQVDVVDAKRNKDGTYEVEATKDGSKIFGKSDMPLKEIEDTFGKDVAHKINDSKSPLINISGDNLKAGGSGMKGFYGSPTEGKLGIVGNVAKKLFGQEPKTTDIKVTEDKFVYDHHNTTIEETPKAYVLKDKDGNSLASFSKEVGSNYPPGQVRKQKLLEIARQNPDLREKVTGNSIQHSIDITPELKASVEGGQPLFKDAEAQYRIESGKNIVEAIKDFNGSPRATVALTHEIMHPTVVAIIDGAKEGNEVGAKHTATIVNEFNKANPNSKVTIEDLIKGNDAFKDGTTSKQYRAVQEFIAKSWEKYHREGGKGFSEAFQKVLDQITKAFQSVYKSLSGKQLTPELRKMFDDILGKSETLLSKEQTEPTTKDVEATDKALEGVDTFHLVENEGKWQATTKTYRGREIGNWAISNLDKKQQKEYLKIRDEAETYGTKEQAEENLKKLKDFEQKNKEAFERAKQEIDALKEAEERKAEERKKQQKIFDQTSKELDKLNDSDYENLVNLVDEKIRKSLEQRFGDRVSRKALFSDRISEAYHKAKADGSNPELVKAVEELLDKPKETSPTPNSKGEGTEVKYQIEESRDEPLASVNPALAEYIRQRMQRLFPSVALFSDKASFEAAAKKVSKGVTFSSAYIGAAIKNLVYVDAEKALQHTEIHEYAHIYWDALPADHPLKTALLDKFGGNEEAAIDAIGRAGTIIMENELDIAKSGFFEKWLKKFWAAVKGVFTSKSIEQAFAERLLTNADEVTEENITSGVVKYMKMKSSAKYSELSEKAVKGIEKIIGKKISSLTFPEYYKHISTEIKPNDFKQWKMLSPQKFLEKMYGIVSPVSTLSPSNKAVFMKQYREYLDDYNWAENNVWTRFASGSMTLTVKEIEDLYMEAYKRKSYGTKDAVNFLADLYSKAVMYKNMQQEIKGDTFNKPFAKMSFDMMSGHEITDLSGSEFVSGKYSLLSPDRVKETILQGREKLYREVQRNATIKEDALKNDFDAIWKRVKDLKSDLRKIVDKTGTYFIDRNSSAYKALRGGTAADRALADLLDMHYKYESAYGGLSMEKGKYRVPVARMDFGGLAKKFGFKEGMRRYFAKPSKYDNVIIDVRSLGLSKPLMTLKQARQEMVKGSNAIYPFQMLKLTKKVDALTKEAYKQFNSGRHANGDIVTTEDLSGSRYGVSFVKDDESSEDLKVSMMLYHYANIENESYDLLSPYSMYIQKYLGRKDKPNMLKWVKMLDDDLIKGESPTSNLGVYAKYVQALTNYTHWLQLGFNIAGMPFNAFAGFAQSVREIGFRNTLKGLRRVIGSLTVGGGAGVVNAKAISIMEKLHIVSLSKDLEMSVTSKIGKGISKIAFLPVSFVEYINHAYSFIGAMDESEWERVKALPANASAEDYTKAMGGNERIDELHTLTQKINGAYSKYSRRGINKTAEGRALMQFKNWLPDVIFAHLTVSQLNEAGEDLYGEYQSGIATSIKNTVWNKTIIPMFKDKSIAQAKKNWETLSEHERMQVGKAMRQLVILGGMALWIASLDDRDDKELKRMLKRAMGDVTYIFDVSNMQFLFDNTVPVFGTIKNLLGLVAEVFSTATGNPSVYEKRQGSHMRGDLKLPVMIENQTPVVNKISKLVNEGD